MTLSITPPVTTRVSSAHAAQLMRAATYASTSVALVLIVLKLYAWSQSNSISLLATLVDSCLDALASVINLLAVRHALTPADHEHRFGHGKAEALAGLGQAAFITGSAGFLLVEAVQRLLNPVLPSATALGQTVMVISIALTLALVLFQRYVVAKTGSTAISADALHYKSDLLVNAAVIVALFFAARGHWLVDPLLALAVGFYILYSAWEIVREAGDHLMDRELPEEEREALKAVLAGQRDLRGYHDLRTRRAGIDTFIQVHIELDDHLNLLQAHVISDRIEEALMAAYPGAEVLIHIDPVSVAAQEPPPPYLAS